MRNRRGHYDGHEGLSNPARFPDGGDMSWTVVQGDGQENGNMQGQRITLRGAVISDNRFIGRLSRDVFKAYGPYDDILTEWFTSDRGITTIIACSDMTQTGFAMLSKPSEMYDLRDVSELLGIAVEPSMQGKGVGELLLRAIEAKSGSLNIKWIFLHTAVNNMIARRLYERAGYRILEVKRGFYPEGQDAMVMYKPVKSMF